MSDRVIKVLGVETHYLTPDGKERLSAVDWWRVTNQLTSVAKKYPDVKVDLIRKIVKEGENVEDEYDKIGRDYDIMYTSYIDTPKAYSWIKAVCEKYGMKHVMDMDDNVFDVDPMNPSSLRFPKGSEALNNIKIIINDVDFMSASTQHLKNVLSEYRSKRIEVLPNFIDPKVYDYKPELVEKHDGIYLGYQGSSTHYTDFMGTGIMFAIKRILDEYENVKFYTIGMAFEEMMRYFDKDRFIIGKGERDHRMWRKTWQKMPIDIGLAPLVDTAFNRSKSSIKYYEYGLRKIPAVYSWVDPYIKVVKEHETGYLAQNELEWYEKIKILVEDEQKRKDMAEKTRQDVLDNYVIDKHVDRIYNYLKEING